MMSRIFVFAFTACAVSACGGAIEQPTDDQPPVPASTLKSASADGTPFGLWNLVSLEKNDSAAATEVHDVLQLDIKADGSVTARRCGKQYYEPALLSVRCGDDASYDCYYGSVAREGDAWRVDLPDLPTTSTTQERIVETFATGEQLKIRYIMPKSSAGVFARTYETPKSMSSSSSVSNCKDR